MPVPVSRATSTWSVLRALWDVSRRLDQRGDGPYARIEQVWERVLELREDPIEYRTVATYLRTLEGKGLVLVKKVDGKLYYKPTVDEAVAVDREIEMFLDNVIHDDPELLDRLAEHVEKRRSLTVSR